MLPQRAPDRTTPRPAGKGLRTGRSGQRRQRERRRNQVEKNRGQAPETISASTAAGMTAMAVDPTAVGSEERGVPAAAAEGRGPEEPEEAELGTLPTERRNPATTHIDTVSTLEMVAMLQRENLRAVAAVGEILPQIAQAVDQVAAALEAGGRLIYMGAAPLAGWVCWTQRSVRPPSGWIRGWWWVSLPADGTPSFRPPRGRRTVLRRDGGIWRSWA